MPSDHASSLETKSRSGTEGKTRSSPAGTGRPSLSRGRSLDAGMDERATADARAVSWCRDRRDRIRSCREQAERPSRVKPRWLSPATRLVPPIGP